MPLSHPLVAGLWQESTADPHSPTSCGFSDMYCTCTKPGQAASIARLEGSRFVGTQPWTCPLRQLAEAAENTVAPHSEQTRRTQMGIGTGRYGAHRAPFQEEVEHQIWRLG